MNRHAISSCHLCPGRLWLIYLAAFVFGTELSDCQATELNWRPNPENDLAGYKVYSGVSAGCYTKVVDVGNTTHYQIQNIESGVTYYLAVTAYDTAGNESQYSEEVMLTAPDDPAIHEPEGDFNDDGIVNYWDLNYFIHNCFGRTAE